jgi:hypothetical protein
MVTSSSCVVPPPPPFIVNFTPKFTQFHYSSSRIFILRTNFSYSRTQITDECQESSATHLNHQQAKVGDFTHTLHIERLHVTLQTRKRAGGHELCVTWMAMRYWKSMGKQASASVVAMLCKVRHRYYRLVHGIGNTAHALHLFQCGTF